MAYVIFDVKVACALSVVVCLLMVMDHDADLDEHFSRLWLPPTAEAWLQVTSSPPQRSVLLMLKDVHQTIFEHDQERPHFSSLRYVSTE